MSARKQRGELTASERLAWHGGGALCVMVGVGLTYFLGIKPTRHQTTELHAERARLEQLVSSRLEVVEAQFVMMEQIQAEQRRLSELRSKVPEENSLDAILGIIGEVAERASVEISGIRPQPGREGRLSEMGELMVILRGSHAELASFLNELKHQPNWVWVAEAQIQPLGTATDDGSAERIEAQLQLCLPQGLKSEWAEFANSCEAPTAVAQFDGA